MLCQASEHANQAEGNADVNQLTRALDTLSLDKDNPSSSHEYLNKGHGTNASLFEILGRQPDAEEMLRVLLQIKSL